MKDGGVTHGHRCFISRAHVKGEALIIVSFTDCGAVYVTVNCEIPTSEDSCSPSKVNRTDSQFEIEAGGTLTRHSRWSVCQNP